MHVGSYEALTGMEVSAFLCTSRAHEKTSRDEWRTDETYRSYLVGIVRACRGKQLLRADARKKRSRATVEFFERSTDSAVATKASNRFGSKQFDQKSP